MRIVKNSPSTANNSPDDAPIVPPLAFRSDGKFLVSIVDLVDTDLSKREVWTGVVLKPAEAIALQQRLNFDEAAALSVGTLRALDKKAKSGKRPKR